jgi:uroporphyrinogen decarboxylase
MRQAGRYQPEYRALRERYSLLQIALNPALATEVTVRPVEAFGVDAAILFSDIMVPLGPLGIRYEIQEGVGPVVPDPIRTGAQVARLGELDPARDLPMVLEAVERIVARLHGVPLIGFAGAPFTLASYLVEGQPTRQYVATKRLMWSDPATWGALMDVLAETAVRYLTAQVRAGAQAVQLFDSWAGALSPADYRQHVLPATRRIFAGLAALGVPRIYFGVGTGSLLELMQATGADVVGVDWRTPLPEARRRLGPGTALQGNLDPVALLAPWPVLAAAADRILTAMRGDYAFVFNLGHGVLPETDPEQVRRLVAYVHDRGGAA